MRIKRNAAVHQDDAVARHIDFMTQKIFSFRWEVVKAMDVFDAHVSRNLPTVIRRAGIVRQVVCQRITDLIRAQAIVEIKERQ
jgi:hypothetical protein